jgi:hypothetical protein
MNEQHGKAADEHSFFFMLPRSFWLRSREHESAIKKHRGPPLQMMTLQKLHTPTTEGSVASMERKIPILGDQIFKRTTALSSGPLLGGH